MELHSNKFVNAIMWAFIIYILWILFSSFILKKSDSTCGCKKKRLEPTSLTSSLPKEEKNRNFTSKEKACLAVGICINSFPIDDIHKWREQVILKADVIFADKNNESNKKNKKKKGNGRRK